MTNEVLQKTASDEQNVSSSNGLEPLPKLRFLEFKNTYKKTKLNEAVERIQRRDPTSEAPVMMLSAASGFIMQSEKYSRENAGQSLKKYILLRKGELAYNHGASKYKPFGCCFELKEDEARIPYVYHCFAVKENNDKSYIARLLNNQKIDQQLKRLISSSVRMDGLLNISYEEYTGIDLYLPSLLEQQKIADFLFLVDRRIAKQRQLVESLKKYKRGLFLKLYNDSEKKGYKICDLGKYCATGALSKDDIDASGKYPCILYGELFTKYGEVIKQVASRTNIIPTYLSGTNEILFPSSTTADAQSLIFPSSLKIKNIFLGGDLFTIKLKNEFDSDFISYLVNFKYKNTLARYAQGITIIHLHYTDIKEQVIDIPNVNTQFNISSVMRKIETIIEMNSNELNSLLLMKKGFLQKMFI